MKSYRSALKYKSTFVNTCVDLLIRSQLKNAYFNKPAACKIPTENLAVKQTAAKMLEGASCCAVFRGFLQHTFDGSTIVSRSKIEPHK